MTAANPSNEAATSLPSPADSLMLHSRTSVLDQARTYRLSGDTLSIQAGVDSGAPATAAESIPLGDVTELWLRYFPTRVQPNRFECLLRTRTGRKIKLTNEFYVGALSFRDESPAYRTFVTALARGVSERNPTAQFRRGRGLVAYVLELIFVSLMFAALAAVLLMVGSVTSWLVVVKLALIAVMLPMLVGYIRRNVPKPLDPRALPPAMLPK